MVMHRTWTMLHGHGRGNVLPLPPLALLLALQPPAAAAHCRALRASRGPRSFLPGEAHGHRVPCNSQRIDRFTRVDGCKVCQPIEGKYALVSLAQSAGKLGTSQRTSRVRDGSHHAACAARAHSLLRGCCCCRVWIAARERGHDRTDLAPISRLRVGRHRANGAVDGGGNGSSPSCSPARPLKDGERGNLGAQYCKHDILQHTKVVAAALCVPCTHVRHNLDGQGLPLALHESKYPCASARRIPQHGHLA
mmetsp:Transcript_48086/g.133291  ORF Transcript_48086/g.133291 Transcript_48086/m.133291 type:complete len:250 (-) Transcript_48086:185-934(-)